MSGKITLTQVSHFSDRQIFCLLFSKRRKEKKHGWCPARSRYNSIIWGQLPGLSCAAFGKQADRFKLHGADRRRGLGRARLRLRGVGGCPPSCRPCEGLATRPEGLRFSPSSWSAPRASQVPFTWSRDAEEAAEPRPPPHPASPLPQGASQPPQEGAQRPRPAPRGPARRPGGARGRSASPR